MTEPDALTTHIDALRKRWLDTCEPATTQQRILDTLRARRRRKRRILWCLLCLGTVLPFGSTGYALVYGVPAALQPWLARVGILSAKPSRETGDARVHAPIAPPPSAAAAPSEAPPSAITTVAPNDEPIVADVAVEQPSPAALERRHKQQKRTPDTIDSSSAETPAQAPDSVEADQERSRALYTHAHRLHFVNKEPEAALNAWESYLANAPLQPLRIEAEYNRALCLVRLGRKQEAARALVPFSEGTHGTYRQRESTALLRALTLDAP